MLLGEYEHTIDDKGRLTLPARFRQQFDAGVVLTRGMDGCIYAYARDRWEALVESRLATLDPLSREGRLMQRFSCSGDPGAAPAGRGRVMVPGARAEGPRRTRYGDVAVVYDHLEIWD